MKKQQFQVPVFQTDTYNLRYVTLESWRIIKLMRLRVELDLFVDMHLRPT